MLPLLPIVFSQVMGLGFTKVGLIPRAGRMRTEFGDCEEYVDAWVFYKSFVDAPACRANL